MSNTPTHGSDVQETPDWWKASDGRFYPPELHPNYVKPAAPAAPPARTTPSLAERLRSEANRVGDEASAAADAGVGTMGAEPGQSGTSAKETIAGAASALGGGAGSVADAAVPGVGDAVSAAGSAAADAVPTVPPIVGSDAVAAVSSPVPPTVPPIPQATPPVVDPRATVPTAPPTGAPVAPVQPTVVHEPGQASAVAPVAAPNVEQGPGGITYTAPASPPAASMPAPAVPGATAVMTDGPAAGYQQPADYAPEAGAGKISSVVAGAIAFVAGLAAIAGSLLQWGKGAVTNSAGVERATIQVDGFDSNGLLTAVCGAVLIICGILLYLGIQKQLYWAIAAFIAGAVIVGAVVFSLIDIADLSNRYAAEWQQEGFAAVGDVIKTQADVGLWIAGAGGVLGVLAAPFVNRT